MDIHSLGSPSFTNGKISTIINEKSHSRWAKLSVWHQEKNTVFLKYRISYQHSQRRYEWIPNSWRITATKGKECSAKAEEETQKSYKKKDTVAGAVSLIIGTSIGSGILALPQKTSPAGIIPSSIAMTICWPFLLMVALLCLRTLPSPDPISHWISLVYHDPAPVLCAYLEGDLKRIRASVLISDLVPLLALLVWDAISFGLSSQCIIKS
ncbi:hypothetical protein K7X08_002713 [Anisodus acutangulus]|uniref:Uncharacterized protein n=1 Tax=Anisodus acutangulus TaxID=402998 RepID=A0A9Q1MFP1_9SOLA|nr:hypothetical protein K7X08_002713 [Anisodus acutangulus]